MYKWEKTKVRDNDKSEKSLELEFWYDFTYAIMVLIASNSKSWQHYNSMLLSNSTIRCLFLNLKSLSNT